MENTAKMNDAASMPEDSKDIVMRIGDTTYMLNLHFSPDAKESLEDKVKKLIRKDIATGNF